MNRLHTTLAITALCALIVGWQFWHRSQDPTLPGSASDPAVTQARPAWKAAPADATERSLRPDQALEKAACTLETHYIADAVTGEIHEATSCEPVFPETPHPYESWSSELLTQEAYADAKAAEILGLRYIRSDDPRTERIGLSLVYRSAALSGDPEVFNRAIGARYAYVAENGEPRLDNLKQLLVFRHLGAALGGAGTDIASIEKELRRNDVPDEEISRIRAGSQGLLEQMADLQTEITGATSIREALENA